jgi:hypothetical protein
VTPRDHAVNTEHDGSVHVKGAPHSSLVLQIDKGVGKQFLLIIWLSAVVTALAVAGLFVAWDGYRHMRQHVNVLQYDLMDLRSKTGHAHENTEETP